MNLLQRKVAQHFLYFILFISVSSSTAQTPSFSRNSFWLETVFNGTIKGKWKYQFDFQYRRMSDASDVAHANKNPFANAFQHVYRPWIHYQLNDNVRFSLSPIGFWETATPASESKTKVMQLKPEFRICPQITLTNKYGRVTMDHRFRYEYRFLGSQKDDPSNSEFNYGVGASFPSVNTKHRIRYFIRAIIPIGKHKKLEKNTPYFIAWNEAFLSFGQNTPLEKVWDQNRTYLLLGYKPNMNFPMRFEIGYGLQVANRYPKIEKNNILQMYIIFENFNQLFQKKKVKTS